MGVLKAIANNETIILKVKIPVDLNDQLVKIKEAAKEHGFTIDACEAAIKAIKGLVVNAQKELKQLEANRQPKKAEPPPPPRLRTAPKTGSAPSARAAAGK